MLWATSSASSSAGGSPFKPANASRCGATTPPLSPATKSKTYSHGSSSASSQADALAMCCFTATASSHATRCRSCAS
ncbi:UNVERIFIED_CONTAM: hypothetical protein GTU68_043620, partial [Idotea baltica]|nr:hypothetical protein [Idotea baltica]